MKNKDVTSENANTHCLRVRSLPVKPDRSAANLETATSPVRLTCYSLDHGAVVGADKRRTGQEQTRSISQIRSRLAIYRGKWGPMDSAL